MLSSLNERNTPLLAFNDYLNVKLAFQEKIVWRDIRKPRIGMDALLARKDYGLFRSLSERVINRADCIDMFVSAALKDSSFYITSLHEIEHKEFHQERVKRCRNLLNLWERDIDNIYHFMLSEDIGIPQLLTKSRVPPIVRKRRKVIGGVSIETFAILHYYFRFCDRKDSSDPLWNATMGKVRAYSAFYHHRPQFEEKIGLLLTKEKP